MALIGGGGSGNVAGGNPSGTGTGLNYIGDYAYGTSGSISDAGTGGANTTLFDFDTSNSFIVGTIDFTNTNSAGHDTYLDIIFNGVNVLQTKDSNASLVPFRFNILIPPYTRVQVKWGSNSTYNGSAFIQGRVYA